MQISSIGNLTKTGFSVRNDVKKNTEDMNFGTFLKNALQHVNQLQNESVRLNELMAAGKVENLHDVTIAAEKADLALQLTIQIRNKIMDAYNEIMRIQV